MKKKGFMILGISVLFCLAFLVYFKKNTILKGTVLKGTVVEVDQSGVLLEPFESETEKNSSDRISISNSEVGDRDLKEGDILKVWYDGTILETFPARLGKIYSVEIVEKE